MLIEMPSWSGPCIVIIEITLSRLMLTPAAEERRGGSAADTRLLHVGSLEYRPGSTQPALISARSRARDVHLLEVLHDAKFVLPRVRGADAQFTEGDRDDWVAYRRASSRCQMSLACRGKRQPMLTSRPRLAKRLVANFF